MKNAILNMDLILKRITLIKKLLSQFSGYILIFLLFLGYTVATSSSIVPIHIFEQGNLSMYGFGDLFFSIFGQNTMIVFILIIYFLNYKSHLECNASLSISGLLIKKILHTAVSLIIIYASILIGYIITCDIDYLNLGFSDRSALRFILPPHWAILLSFVFSLFYLVTFSLIASIIENQARKSWLAILISISIAYIDIGIRFGFRSKELIGVLLSDNASVFYLDSIFSNINRPSYINSIVYWIVLIAVLCFLWFLLNKRRLQVMNNEKI